jgi:hypothetical protein
MSTESPHVAPTRPAFVPSPRQPAEPPSSVPAPSPPATENGYAEPEGVYSRHPWLVPATGVACVLAIFVAMMLLTLLAGGITPFND